MEPVISDDYLREEEREGFVIPEKMKRSWATKLKLLCRIDEILTRYGLTWYVDYGTLLGAVRHRGFVPWDDDMDISMPRRDYDIALQILARELPADAHVSFFGQTDFEVPWSYVNNRQNTDLGDDYVPADPSERGVFLEIHETLYEAIQNYASVERENRVPEYAAVIRDLTGQELPTDERFRPALCMLQDALAKLYPKEQSIGIENIANMAHHARDRWRNHSVYDGTLYLPFEMIEVPVPVGYEELLMNTFGAGWTTPVKHTATHGYPFYQDQERMIEEHRAAMGRGGEQYRETGPRGSGDGNAFVGGIQ